MTQTHAGKEPKQFWEERYANSGPRSRGKAGQLLMQMTAKLVPQRVLELGCSTGDDTLWLAEQGWQVTGVDISEQAIQVTQCLAEEAGLAESRFICRSVTSARTFQRGNLNWSQRSFFNHPIQTSTEFRFYKLLPVASYPAAIY